MRPTWHLVAPQDIRTLLALTAPRVHAANAHMYRKLELNNACLSRCRAVLERTLADNRYLSRSELATHLSKNGIEAVGQRLAYILMHAELEALICSGPRRGKQFTYALLDERAPMTKQLGRDESLAEWTLRYFASHGPAQLKDFVWWSGLATRDAERGLNLAQPRLEREIIENKRYWFSPKGTSASSKAPEALLLSIYDEYTIAYRDRSALDAERYIKRLFAMGNALTSVLILEGKIAGTWKRVVKNANVAIVTSPFRRLHENEFDAVRRAANKYGEFLQMDTAFSVNEPESET